MKEKITTADLARMMMGAVTQIRAQHAWLSQLDSVAGDGDHGASMLRIAECLERVFSSAGSSRFGPILHDAGWGILNLDGGASTALLGTFFLGMADAPVADASALDCSELASIFNSGLAAVKQQTRAQPGDKTMMDALVPAVEALSLAAVDGKDIGDALADAAHAAGLGAASTKDLIARHGRARLLGEKTRGSQDPGATSIALIFAGFAACDKTPVQPGAAS
jgi:dihydroxyacetone kinase-like protein